MALRRKKGYQFSDEVMSKDALISLIFGFVALVIIVFSITFSIIKKGNVPDFIGALLLACIVMDINSFIFGFLSFRDSDGGILGKRASIIVAVLDAVLLLAIYLI
ncbi:MAG: hypothetical protein K6F55_08880 [Eubacterium sp.]|nr:hypothetical protein [Eubacterium sp.]